MDSNEDLMTIGQFATASGLSVHALRHYDRVGVLKPSATDARTKYRRYRRQQISTARLIRYLRSADLSIDEILQILKDDANPIAVLRDRRQRLARELKELRARLRRIRRLTLDAASVLSEGLLDSEAYDLLTPEHYLLEHEIMLETTNMTIDEAMEAEQLLCALYDIKGIEFDYEPETRSHWTILIPAAVSDSSPV
jgi:DNA-binding transcriptional MerR regulator